MRPCRRSQLMDVRPFSPRSIAVRYCKDFNDNYMRSFPDSHVAVLDGRDTEGFQELTVGHRLSVHPLCLVVAVATWTVVTSSHSDVLAPKTKHAQRVKHVCYPNFNATALRCTQRLQAIPQRPRYRMLKPAPANPKLVRIQSFGQDAVYQSRNCINTNTLPTGFGFACEDLGIYRLLAPTAHLHTIYNCPQVL